jgi:hypothetical protein
MSAIGPLLLAFAIFASLVAATFLSRRQPVPGAPARLVQRDEPVTLPAERVQTWPGAAAEPQPRETTPFDTVVRIGPTEHAHTTVPQREAK